MLMTVVLAELTCDKLNKLMNNSTLVFHNVTEQHIYFFTKYANSGTFELDTVNLKAFLCINLFT